MLSDGRYKHQLSKYFKNPFNRGGYMTDDTSGVPPTNGTALSQIEQQLRQGALLSPLGNNSTYSSGAITTATSTALNINNIQTPAPRMVVIRTTRAERAAKLRVMGKLFNCERSIYVDEEKSILLFMFEETSDVQTFVQAVENLKGVHAERPLDLGRV